MTDRLTYHALSPGLQARIKADRAAHWENPWRFRDGDALRRDMGRDKPTLWRPTFVRDTEKILHLPLYNRYADKTQVFSFYENDDLTRRGLHVQLVSRIARNIGAVLGLNLDLIEAIALGHDMGHTPFGHAGERFLDELLQEFSGRRFLHNAQSVRVLDAIFRRNLTLQTLDGILCHNGELEREEYRPGALRDFAQFDSLVQGCETQGDAVSNTLMASTLEGCVVRVSDMIAYLGKDRQDAVTARIIPAGTRFTTQEIGEKNAQIINNMTVDLIENSYGKDHIALSPQTYEDLRTAKRENYGKIYQNEAVSADYEHTVRPMFREMFLRLRQDLKEGRRESPAFRHHMDYVERNTRFYPGERDYREEPPEAVAADYIASMTDDYFLSLYRYLFPKSGREVKFHGYFEE